MASITLTVPNGVVTRITNAIGYSATLPDGSPNAVSATQAIKDFLANDIKAQVKSFESPAVAATAVTANNQNIDSQIIIT